MRTEVQGCVGPDHPALAGHFPGRPVVPGVVVLTEILMAVERLPEWNRHDFQLKSVKFTAPLRPGDPFTIALESSSARQLSFVMTQANTRIAWGTLQLITDHAKQDVL
jgi:3-hydroxyacyl-[acyl-carrier-protein] dehydratase